MVIKMRKIWEKNSKLILAIFATIILASGATYAATTMYDSNIVGYNNTTSGLRSTTVQTALDELYGNVAEVIINMKSKLDELYAVKLNGDDSAGYHNSIYRGKNISSYMPSSVVSGGDGTIYDRINGTNGYAPFEDLYVGDYIVANSKTWRIAGFDILDMVGSSKILTSHHVAIVPDEILGSAQMNTSNTTSGGYVGSAMYTTLTSTTLPTYITPVFGSHVLEYNTVLSNSVGTSLYNRYGSNTGASNGWGWYTRKLDLMNEVQVTGATEWSSSGYDIGSDNIQFPLFRLRPGLKIAYNSTTHSTSTRTWYWLRSVSSSSYFAHVTNDGNIHTTHASNYGGVRPAFYIG